MKSNLTTAMFCALAISVSAQDAPSVPTLTGIINVPGYKVAVFERTARFNRLFILMEGERFEGIEISQINPQTLKVNARIEGSPTTLGFKTNYPSVTGSDYGLVLESANLDPVLRIYSEISKRTLLRPTGLPAVLISASEPGTNSTEVVGALERALAEKGIVTIPDGDKFVMVVIKAMADKVKPRSKEIKSSDPNGSQTVARVRDLNLTAATSDQVIALYAGFTGRKLDRSEGLPPSRMISFQNVNPLTRDEVIYALDTLLDWNGIKLVPGEGDLLHAELIPEK
jgi:hypothetical protein